MSTQAKGSTKSVNSMPTAHLGAGLQEFSFRGRLLFFRITWIVPSIFPFLFPTCNKMKEIKNMLNRKKERKERRKEGREKEKGGGDACLFTQRGNTPPGEWKKRCLSSQLSRLPVDQS